MKKLFGMVALAACLSLVGASDAKAAGPFYIYFTDYCDCITLTRAGLVGHTWFFGTWDWECTGGASSTLIHGEASAGQSFLGTHPIDSTGAPAGFSVSINLDRANPGAGHAHATATFDGTTNVEIAEEADYFFRTSPACPGPPNNKPRMIP